ncbi:DUF2194 domain-containing protein [Rossellomorea vietnamensis]|uniref:DUF2194 domain-containing protein n=1 Tax=Rossellomorea vietnamensis TaxID=218284 RepID=A0A5D4K7S2_9BACI|nr:DUF2194 domain-containing protein [Rossellomorea vietnamensis]TYR73411.1 DUF2194 domain-containing protein [Rossellomorea vietnamensis]
MDKLKLNIGLAGIVFLIGLAAFQFLRMENVHEVITPVVSAEKDFTTMSAAGDSAGGQTLKVYFAGDGSESSKRLNENLSQGLHYGKVPYEHLSVDEISELEPSPFHVLVLGGENSKAWPYKEVEAFVEKGGRLIFASRFNDQAWYDLAGIEETYGFSSEPSYGFTFHSAIFPGYGELGSDTPFAVNSTLEVSLKENANTLISSEEQPVLWSNLYGEGKVFFWNTTMLESKNLRGLFLHSIGLAVPAFVTGQAAVQVIFIDDFPSPVPAGSSSPVKEQYGLSIADFYKKIWWEDMKAWSEKYGLKYTSPFIGTYRSDMELSVDDMIKKARRHMTFYGRELLEAEGEIGFHGYNHQSLVTEAEPADPSLGYRPWKDQDEMEEGLKRAKAFFEHFYPNQQLKSYVPPSNIINETGIAALQNIMPDIETVASLYVADADKGYFGQEFEFDEKYENLYHFPRITSRYNFHPEDEFVQTDAIANFGVVSHFFHPDDVLDEHRAGDKGWPELKADFEKNLKKLAGTYPWLEPLTMKDARNKLIKYQEAELEVAYSADSIEISGQNILNPSHLIVRVQEGKRLETGNHPYGQVSQLEDETGLYLVKLTRPQAKLLIKEW